MGMTLTADVTLTPQGLVVSVLTGKTKHSVRNAKINYQDDHDICPVRAWTHYRERLAAEADPGWSRPDAPAFVGIDRWANVTGGTSPTPSPSPIRAGGPATPAP